MIPSASEPGPRLNPWTTPQTIFRAGLVLILALYIRTIRFDLVFDDVLLQQIPWLHSWSALVEAFLADNFGGVLETGSSYYRPMVLVWWALVDRLTPGSPAWYHLASIVTQVVVYFTAFLFGREFFEDETLAALTAVLFVLHPCQVEVVAWAESGANNGQAAIYFFAVLIFYLRWWKTRTPAWLVGSAAFYLLALFSKEALILTPLLVAVHAVMQSERGSRWRNALLVLISYLVVLAPYFLFRQMALRPLASQSNAIRTGLQWRDLWSAPAAFVWYLRKLIVPTGMAVIHDWSPVTAPSLVNFAVPLLVLLALCALVWLVWKKSGSWRVLFLAVLFLVNLLPVVAYANRVTMHERYLQLPSYSFCALLAYGVLVLMRQGGRRRVLGIASVIVIAGAWSAITWYESGFWENNMTLWTRGVAMAPRSVNARVELARLYTAASNTPAAIAVLDDGLRVLPNSPGLWRTRGSLLFDAGKLDESRLSLLHALEASKRFPQGGTEPPDVKYGRASASFMLGKIAMLKEEPQAADGWLRTALAIDPGNPNYRKVMAANLRKLGKNDEAAQFERSLDTTEKD